jgi:NADH:ubiquinone oxidoreductase subunit 6 (subunit J)
VLLARLSPGALAGMQGSIPGAGTPLGAFAAAQAGLARGDSVSVGVVGSIAEPLFKTFLVPFEITSILLLAAAVGAVVLAKRKL